MNNIKYDIPIRDSYQDFLALLFLYTASVDLDLSGEEERIIIDKVGSECYHANRSIFKRLNDAQILELLYELGQKLCITEEEKKLALMDIDEIIHAEGRKSRMEEDMLLFVNKLILT